MRRIHAPHWQQLEGTLHYLQAFAHRKRAFFSLLGHWLKSLALVWGRIVRMLGKILLEGGVAVCSLRNAVQARLRPETYFSWQAALQLPMQLKVYLPELNLQYRLYVRQFERTTSQLTTLRLVLPMLGYVSHQVIDALSRW